MNKRRIDGVSDARLVDYIRSHYTYDAQLGVVRNRKGEVLKGSPNGRGYMITRVWMGGELPTVSLHQIVWVVVHGQWPTQIDHINGVKTDNRIENLREVNQSSNNFNRLLAWLPNKDSGLPGVFKDKRMFKTKVQQHKFYGQDKYQVFILGIMLGKMYQYGKD